MTGLTINVTGEHELCAIGELDLHTAAELSEGLATLISGAAGQRLCLDLSKLTYIDSSGLSTLIAAHQQAEAVNSTLVIWRPADPVSRMLSVTGMASVFTTVHAESPSPTGGK